MCSAGSDMKRGSADGRRFYRRRVLNGTLFILCGWATIVFWGLGEEAISKDDGPAVITLCFILFAICLVPTIRCPFYGVVITDTKVRVRNILRTHVLRWDEIDRFEYEKYDPWPLIGVVWLKNGRRVPMGGIQWALLSKFAENTVAALNERLATMRDGQEPKSGPAGEHPSEQSIQAG